MEKLQKFKNPRNKELNTVSMQVVMRGMSFNIICGSAKRHSWSLNIPWCYIGYRVILKCKR